MEYALSELFTLQMGKTPSRDNSSYWKKSENNWISIADLTNSGKYISNTKETLSDSAVAESGIKKIPANTVIMSFKLSLGKVAITEKEMYSNEAIMAFIDKGVEKISPEYLYYLLRAKDWSKGTNKAVMGATLNKATLSTIKIQLHEYDNQLEIVNMLNRVSSSIDFRKQQLTKLDELIKARFVEMFGDPISNTKRWDVIELGSLTGIGSSKRIFEKEYVSEGIPFYRTKEIVELSKGNPISTELYITEKRFLEIKEQYGVPQKGDLLISAVGTIGVIWIVDEKNDFYFKDGNLIRVDSSDRFNSTYMKTLLESLIAEYKKQMSSGTAYSALTISGLMKMKIYDVPLSLQNQFADFVAEVDKSKLFAELFAQSTCILAKIVQNRSREV